MDERAALRAFLAALPAPDREELEAAPALGGLLAGAIERSRAAWPGVVLGEEAFAAYLAARLPPGDDAAARLEQADLPQLYLACACGRGDPAAIGRFDERVFAPVAGRLRRLGLSGADVDEVRQQLHERLFVARPPDGPRIDDYAGRGDLGGLVHVIAVRAALDLLRRHGREAASPEDDLLRLPVAGPDPELEVLKAHCRAAFKEAFEAAVAGLSPRARNLLRLHLVDGVTLEQLARSYRVHRATIVRWLQRARGDLLAALRRDLGRRLGADSSELAALIDLARSRVELSLSRVLAPRDPTRPAG